MGSSNARSATQASISQQVVDWAIGLRFDQLPDDVVVKARELVLDALGVTLASSAQEFGRRFDDLDLPSASGRGSTIVGRPCRWPADKAALVNGTLAHGIDFDETYQPGFVHVVSLVIPPALAVAEDVEASAEQTLTAIVAGYELASRLGEAAPAGFHRYGWHATPLCGAFGAALAASLLLGSSAERTVTALGIVGSFASGIQEFLKDGTDTKRLHAGWAASAGIAAADLARIGFGGPARILEGDFGLYATHLREGDFRDLDLITAGLGERWNIERASIKPFPCCLQMHAHVEAARRLASAGVDPTDIVAVRAYIQETGMAIIADPIEMKRRPTTPYGAQFSLPFGVAVGLTRPDQPIDLRSFAADRLEDPEMIRLAGMTECLHDDEADSPQYRGGAVEVDLQDGRTLSERVAVNLGSPGNPIEREGLVEKFIGNAVTAGIDGDAARKASDEILTTTDIVGSVSRLNQLLPHLR